MTIIKNHAWHMKHGQKLKKRKMVRQYHIADKVLNSATANAMAEYNFKQAQEREKQAILGRMGAIKYFLFRRWLAFISIKPVVWVRKVAYRANNMRYGANKA